LQASTLGRLAHRPREPGPGSGASGTGPLRPGLLEQPGLNSRDPLFSDAPSWCLRPRIARGSGRSRSRGIAAYATRHDA